MQTFKIRQGGFKDVKKQMLIRTIPIMLVAATAGLLIGSINSKGKADDVDVLPIVIPLIVIALGFGLYRGINRQRSLFDSYTLTITNNLVTREQLNTPTISIYFNEIIEIIKYKNGSLLIKGKDSTDLISIPAQIDNYSQLELTLQKILPITNDRASILRKYQGVTALVAIGLMFCVYTVNNKIIVGLSASILVPLMLWGFVKVRNSKNVDNKTKKIFWWVLLVLVSIIAVTILKLTGFAGSQRI